MSASAAKHSCAVALRARHACSCACFGGCPDFFPRRYALWKDKLHIDEVKATGIDPRAADRTTSKFIVGAGTQDLAGKVAWNTCALLNPQDRAAIDKKECDAPGQIIIPNQRAHSTAGTRSWVSRRK